MYPSSRSVLVDKSTGPETIPLFLPQKEEIPE